MKRLFILTICSVIVSSVIFVYKKQELTTISNGDGLVIKKEWLFSNQKSMTAKNDIRPADQTFLTFPEWYLVFSPEEQAQFFRKKTATNFSFVSHTKQIWESYYIINNQIKDNFPTNYGYHFMIWVIGTSTSIEYLLKSWYETIVGRLTDTFHTITDEDKFNAKFTEDYVIFIKDRPWYEFDFKSQLKKLWADTSFFGDHFIRKLERKYILTSELLVKWGYGHLIAIGTKQVYDEALPTTAVLLQDNSIIHLPRYDKFNKSITELSKKNKSFKEIAGNRSAILLTVLLPKNTNYNFGQAQIVFTQPISSNQAIKRIAVAILVENLSDFLRQLDKDKIQIEHVFDF